MASSPIRNSLLRIDDATGGLPPPFELHTHPLFELLQRLDAGRHHYSISRHRPDSVLITATFVGERTEIDVFDDGHMEVSRFLGTEDVLGDAELVWQLLDNKPRPRKPLSKRQALCRTKT